MDKRIEKMERDSDGFWIYLKPGFARYGEHIIVEDTRRKALSCLSEVKSCGCNECKNEMAR